MTIHLEYKDEKSAKFWRITLENTTHTVTYGKIGTDGQSKTKTFESAEKALKDAQKLIKAKKKKGYEEIGETEGKTTDETPTKPLEVDLIQEDEARERFDLDQYGLIGEIPYDNILVLEGSVVIDSTIDDDSVESIFFGEGRETEEELIIINGNLTVEGDINISENYPCLLVLGDIHCEVLHSYDNITHVTGGAHIKYAYNGNYNHGSITISGTTHVPYLLNSDHDSTLYPSAKTILINYYGNYDDFFVYDYYREDLPNIFVKNALYKGSFDYGILIDYLKTGKSPLKKGTKPSRILVEKEIKKIAKKNKTGEGLKELDLTEKKLQKLPKAVFDLDTLEVLLLDKNSFKAVPKEIEKLSHLKELSFKNTAITALPNTIGQLKNLEELNLSYCRNLKSLPSAIGELSSLKKLILWSFQGEVPASISKLTTLEELDINNCYGYGVEPVPFPTWILNLVGLKKLSVKENSFQNLPKELTQLISLEELNLNAALCYVKEFPDLSSLQHLKRLSISGSTNLNTRPLLAQEVLQHFFNITTLEYLDISSFNKKNTWMPTPTVTEKRAALQDQPKKLAAFESRLNLHSNGNYYYDIRRNIIHSDFKGLDKLVNLRELDIRYNNLDSLPPEVLQLTQLEKIHVHGNNLSSSDLDALRQMNPAIEIV